MKLFKKGCSKKNKMKLAVNALELIDLTLEDPGYILRLANSGIVGTSIQSQKISRMIIMVSEDYDMTGNSKDEIRNRFGLMVWEYEDRDVFYIAGSLSNFYNMCMYNIMNYISDSLTNFIIYKLLEADYECNDRFNAPLFTPLQLISLDRTLGDNVNKLDEKRSKEMIMLIDPMHCASYDIRPVVFPKDDKLKGTIMSMAQFCFVGKDRIIAYMNPYIKYYMEKMIGRDLDEDGDKKEQKEIDDMIAIEVVE